MIQIKKNYHLVGSVRNGSNRRKVDRYFNTDIEMNEYIEELNNNYQTGQVHKYVKLGAVIIYKKESK